MKRDIKLYISDIKQAVSKIEKYTKPLSLEKFKKSDMTVDAVAQNNGYAKFAYSRVFRH